MTMGGDGEHGRVDARESSKVKMPGSLDSGDSDSGRSCLSAESTSTGSFHSAKSNPSDDETLLVDDDSSRRSSTPEATETVHSARLRNDGSASPVLTSSGDDHLGCGRAGRRRGARITDHEEMENFYDGDESDIEDEESNVEGE